MELIDDEGHVLFNMQYIGGNRVRLLGYFTNNDCVQVHYPGNFPGILRDDPDYKKKAMSFIKQIPRINKY